MGSCSLATMVSGHMPSSARTPAMKLKASTILSITFFIVVNRGAKMRNLCRNSWFAAGFR